MNTNLTELVFIIDRSGSMHGLEADTIGGFNSVIEAQKKLPGSATVTTILFDHEIRLLHDRLPLQAIAPMTEQEYHVGGCTALLDAIGTGIEKIDNVVKYLSGDDRPGHIQFVVITDGMENASKRFHGDDIRRMVNARREEDWDFVFLGANMDAIAAARGMGFSEDRAVTAVSDHEGVQAQYEAVNAAVCENRFRNFGAPLSKKWRDSVEKDRKRRGI